MRALIDSDIFTYSIGSAKTDEGHPLEWQFCAARLNMQLKAIRDAVEATSHSVYLTGKSNFRLSTATIKPYKGTRPAEKPHHYQRVRDYLVDFHKAEVVEGMEADDKLAIEQIRNREICEQQALGGHSYTETIICSIDKDLLMVPGWHYNWVKDKKTYVTPLDGSRAFYSQLLTGDGVDNIPGLFGVGSSSAAVKFVQQCDSDDLMYRRVRKEYSDRFGSYWQQFLEENACLLWMKRLENDPLGHENEARSLIREMEARHSAQNWSNSLQNSLTEML